MGINDRSLERHPHFVASRRRDRSRGRLSTDTFQNVISLRSDERPGAESKGRERYARGLSSLGKPAVLYLFVDVLPSHLFQFFHDRVWCPSADQTVRCEKGYLLAKFGRRAEVNGYCMRFNPTELCDVGNLAERYLRLFEVVRDVKIGRVCLY